ncbi:hypothetical protein [Mahella australiensis]|uniref:Uncharacterized protein n=1 Tax=Mahella australiensis (strain DSM 15567 / CIP 107919 / 50-1 BON) TaxID=697281 RepID=F3ZVG8_MAHA5|nr:hypothetical protein [Mahella australiensis]AEE95318.1 hypothetical protein Mahau_0095 [Mahella australiensis 50-1 BON]
MFRTEGQNEMLKVLCSRCDEMVHQQMATNYLLLKLVKHATGEKPADQFIEIAFNDLLTESHALERIKNFYPWLKEFAEDKADDSANDNKE